MAWLRRVVGGDASIVSEVSLASLMTPGEGPQSIRAGRHPSNDVILDTDSPPLLCSRFHSLLQYDHAVQACVVVDLGSSNGTFVRLPSRTRWLGRGTGRFLCDTPRC
jgi:pSer/pThr/pTyr-binding forkhead associated (FHA) protein